MTFRPSAPNKKPRWLALLAIVVVGGALMAAPVFADLGLHAIPDPGGFTADEAGANDEPGQKDLTAQGSSFHEGDFYTGWKWDDTSWSGKNSGDGCNLFDEDDNGNADYVVCATIGTVQGALTLQSVTVYSCSDNRADRCTNPTSLTTSTTNCVISNTASNGIDPTNTANKDTVIVCNITDIATATGVTALASSTIINTCSYPSREPNSDPSDCIFEAPSQNVALTTDSTASTIASWSATVKDTATLTPAGTGSVTFGLYSDSTCTTLVAGSESTDSTAPFAATDVTVSGTTEGTFTYYWKVHYTADPGFIAPADVCGEDVTITISVTGTAE
jgi:hypothetical protein